MPRRRDEQAVIAELEAQRKRIESRIRDTRHALATRQANERAAQRATHEAAMMRVIKRYSFEGATPEQLEGALRAAGLQMRGKAEPVVSYDTFVGKKRDRLVAIGPVNFPVSSQFINKILEE